MRKIRSTPILCVAAMLSSVSLQLATFCAEVQAQAPAKNGPEPAASAPRRDFFEQGFVQDAEHIALAQIGAGDAAARRAAEPNVRNFAQMMVADHTNIDDDLRQLAVKKDVILPAATDPFRQSVLSDLRHKQDKDFDNAYLQLEVHEQEQAVRLYRRAAESEDADVRGFAQRNLPVLQRQLQLAQALNVDRNAPLSPTTTTD